MALYACPNCKGEQNLIISTRIDGLLIQSDDGEKVETKIVSSYMSCNQCGWEGQTNDALKSNSKEQENDSSS